MYNIKLLNKISSVGLDNLPSELYNATTECEAPDAILVRSAKMHDMSVSSSLKAVARAGAGVNNIPVDEYADKGIVVFNTPGANANGVKELAIAALFLTSRDIVGGIEWTKTLNGDVAKEVEAGKSKFSGCEIKGKTLGVIGLGAIGGMVANAAVSLGMNVMGYDPYLSINAAWRLSPDVCLASSYDEIFEKSDYITLHVPATPQTKNMISAASISKMKNGVKIINLSRADLVCIEDVKSALSVGKITRYITDFPTPEAINVPGILTIPHLGASTEESEDNCAVMAVSELRDYIERGNIKNSVNYPSVSLQCPPTHRIVVLGNSDPCIISAITATIENGSNSIVNIASGTKEGKAAVIAELGSDISDALLSSLSSVPGVIRVIKIK